MHLSYTATAATAATPDTPEAVNPQELADLQTIVSRTLVACFPTAVQTAVTAAALTRGEDWSQEARWWLRETGHAPGCAGAPMYVSYDRHA